MNKTILEQVGLSKGEAEIYHVLLKIGEATASEVAKHTKIARPNVYDYLNKLKDKGLVSFVTKRNKVHYIPASPEKILDYLEEKRDLIKQELPNLLRIYQPKKEKQQVEVYEGAEGFKTLINDIIRTGKDFVGWGASSKVKEYVPEYIVARYLKEREKRKIKAKLLFVETEGIIQTPLSTFKSISKEYSSPATTLIYDNKVAILIYTAIPLIILIKSKELADSYRKHFELLWMQTKRKSIKFL